MGIYYDPGKTKGNRWVVNYENENNRTDFPETRQETFWNPTKDRVTVYGGWFQSWQEYQGGWDQRTVPDTLNIQLNKENRALNEVNRTKNKAYDTVLATANRTQGGDYVVQREALKNITGIDDALKKDLQLAMKKIKLHCSFHGTVE